VPTGNLVTYLGEIKDNLHAFGDKLRQEHLTFLLRYAIEL
jgi:hypothetical protein